MLRFQDFLKSVVRNTNVFVTSPLHHLFDRYFIHLKSSRIYYSVLVLYMFCMTVLRICLSQIVVVFKTWMLCVIMTTQLVAIDPIRTIYLHIFLFLLSFITLAHARLLTIRISSQTESSQDCCVFIFLVTYDVIEYNLIMPPARRTLPFALAHSTSFAEGRH